MRGKVLICMLLFLCLVLPCSEARAAGEIRIDGYYDDWEGIPKTNITYGNHNLTEYHEYGLLFDGEYLYGYVGLSESYTNNIPADMYYISIDGSVQSFVIWGRNEDDSRDYSRSIRDQGLGRYVTEYGLYLNEYHPTFTGSAAIPAITISSGERNDQMEFAMPVSVLEEIYGFEPGDLKNGAMIEMWCPNLGDEKATVQGTSSGPILGVALCLAVVGGVWLYRKKGKQEA